MVADVSEPGMLGSHLAKGYQGGVPVIVIFGFDLRRVSAIESQAVRLPIGQKCFCAGWQAQRIGQVGKAASA